ncbi:DNA cytosine methyltransferase [Anaerococcus senegalensis]|uniref:DNA cytosine methyltransferase n=1 Tax=Anaerococcus senegalensis TaxID=1288120 RepID=UPI0003114D8E|nr:DNA cytosine methyltransferase [Anaerococcus senegalensis]
MIRLFEAFAGVGTQAMALKRIDIDYEVVGISEIDKFALKSYEQIHGKVNNYGDISKINPDNLPDFDLFTYSFPCQDISMAGKQAGFGKDSGTRSSLLWECERIIKNKKPKYLLMENVKALTFKKNIEGFNTWLKTLEDIGYKNYWKVLNAKDYGVPQNRERVFCVSILGDEEYKFPEKQILKTRLKDFLEDKVDEKYYLSNDRVRQLIKIIKDDDVIVEPKIIQTHTGGRVKQPCIPIKNSTKKGYLKAYPGDGIDLINPNCKNRRGRVQKDSIQTLTCGDNRGVVADDLRIRKLTPLECWRLMGIDDEDFYKAQKVNSDSQLYKQAGNAIVVDVLAAIFMNCLKDELIVR